MKWIKDRAGALHETTGASIIPEGDTLLLVSTTGPKNAERKITLARGLSDSEMHAITEKIEGAIVREQQLVSI